MSNIIILKSRQVGYASYVSAAANYYNARIWPELTQSKKEKMLKNIKSKYL